MAKILLLQDDDIVSRSKRGLRVVHTADWHLGGGIYLHNLLQEQKQFLLWLVEQLSIMQADVLIVAGDVFDTRVPSNATQNLYYDFLSRVRATCCREVLILGGNHDSASFINSPKKLLEHFQIYVQGNFSHNPQDVCRTILNEQGEPVLLIGAVPYLREAEVCRIVSGESYQVHLNRRYRAGLTACYEQVWQELEKCQQSLASELPVLLTGHLPVQGAKLTADESPLTAAKSTEDAEGSNVYIGNLFQVNADVFPAATSYVALGHLHYAQNLGQRQQIRYSGTPMPMSFSEKEQPKSVTLLEFTDELLYQQEIYTEKMYDLREIEGNWSEIKTTLQELKSECLPQFLKISYTGDPAEVTEVDELREILDASRHEIVHFANLARRRLRRGKRVKQSLQELTPEMVFKHCLQQWTVPEEKMQQLLDLFNVAQRHLQADADAAELAAAEVKQ